MENVLNLESASAKTRRLPDELREAARSLSPEARARIGKTQISNGSKLLPMTDGRSVTARRYKDLLAEFQSDLGGASRLSEGQKQLARRCAMLSAESERMEAQSIAGEPFDLPTYLAMCGTLARLLGKLGLRRHAIDVDGDDDRLSRYFDNPLPQSEPPEAEEQETDTGNVAEASEQALLPSPEPSGADPP